VLIDSITRKLWPLGDDVTFVPGHGPTSTFGQERQTNPFVADRNRCRNGCPQEKSIAFPPGHAPRTMR
jgi:hypothetical protein